MFSLGREPQVFGQDPHPKPCRGDRSALRREPQRFHVKNLSPLRGLSNFFEPFSWGSRPRLSIFRAFGAC